MKILTLSLIAFGKFKQQTYHLHPELHLFYGYNEAGKTTLIHFIEGMLYGFYDPFKKGRRTYPLYERYLPASDHYQGALELEHQGLSVRLERDFKKHTLQVFSVNTGEDITDQLPYDSDIKQADIGAWLDIPYALYQNTIRISQSDLLTSSSAEDELFQRLANLNQTQSMSFSGDDALKYLKDLKDAIGTSKSPTKPYALALSKKAQLTSQKAMLEETSKRLEDLEKTQQNDKDALEQLMPQYEALKKQKETQHQHQIMTRILPLKALYEKDYQSVTGVDFATFYGTIKPSSSAPFSTLKKPPSPLKPPAIMLDDSDYHAALHRLKSLEKTLDTHQQTLRQTEKSYEDLEASLERLDAPKPFKKPRLTWSALWIVPFLIFLFKLVIYRFKIKTPNAAYQRQEKERIKAAMMKNKTLMQTLEKECVAAEEALDAFLNKYQLDKDNAQVELYQIHQESLAYHAYESALKTYHQAVEMILKTQAKTLAALNLPQDVQGLETLHGLTRLHETITLQTAGYDFFTLIQLNSQEDASFNEEDLREIEDERLRLIQAISKHEANIQAALDDLSGFDKVQVALSDVTIEIEGYEARLKTIEQAEKLLKKSMDIIEENFAPALSEAIEKHLNVFTLGRYQDVKIRKSLDFKVSAEGLLKEALHFSTATLDQIHFAIRLGMIDVLGLKDMPLLLDDAFMHFDIERLESIVKVISSMPHQRLIWTAHTREETILKKLGVPFERTQLHD